MKKNLKIIIPVIVAIVILAIVGIVFFTSNTETTKKIMSKDEMLAVAQDKTSMGIGAAKDYNNYFSQLSNNKAKAESEKGKCFIVEDTVTKVEKDYALLGKVSILHFKIYLPTEELLNLKSGDKIAFVGRLKEIETEQKMDYGNSIEAVTFVFENCYIITDVEY